MGPSHCPNFLLSGGVGLADVGLRGGVGALVTDYQYVPKLLEGDLSGTYIISNNLFKMSRVADRYRNIRINNYIHFHGL